MNRTRQLNQQAHREVLVSIQLPLSLKEIIGPTDKHFYFDEDIKM